MINSSNLFIPEIKTEPVGGDISFRPLDDDETYSVNWFEAHIVVSPYIETDGIVVPVVRWNGSLWVLEPKKAPAINTPPPKPPAVIKPGTGGTIGSTPHSLVSKYQVKVLVSNKHGYVEIKNPAIQGGSFMLANLVYINRTLAADIDSVIDFPPRFKGDLLWLEGKHFYSPNEDSYYYYVGAPDVKVSCYYHVQLEETIRKMRANECNYLVVTETAKYKHDELYTVAGYHLRYGAMLIFSETEVVIPDVVGEQDLPPGVTPPVPPPPAVREKFKVGSFEFLLPFGDGGLGPHDSEWIDAMGDEAEYSRLKAQFLKSQAKTVTLTPRCSQTDKKTGHVYNPANVYNRRTFYCPANDTYYVYVGYIQPTKSDDKGPYYEVVYYHYPKTGEYAQTDLVVSGLYVDAQTFDQMILNS